MGRLPSNLYVLPTQTNPINKQRYDFEIEDIMANAPTMNMMGTLPSLLLNSYSSMHSPRIPIVGMGTAADPFDAYALKAAVPEAIKLGYRHFDTAASYGSEQPLGEAIAEALRLSLLDSRQELFITSKLWCGDAHPDRVLPALRKSLRKLKLEYLDLYLIHWPISIKPGKYKFDIDKKDLIPMDLKSVWGAMEECQRLGLTRSIGVCNFSCKKLQNLLSFSNIPPAVNQVEMSPVWQQKKLREFCNSNGIIVTAYSPLGAKGASWGTNQVMDCDILKDIAKATHKTVAQVSLRWVYEQGVSLLVKSTNKKRMEENVSIFDWELTEDDHNKINQIKQQRGLCREDFVSLHGPYKSLDQLWDGEL